MPLFETRIDELRERFGQGTKVPGGTAGFQPDTSEHTLPSEKKPE